MVTKPNATTERLLDAAERLFGEDEYSGVGMRALAQAAGVNLAATTYHFGSKKALYVETFMRRFRQINAERLAGLKDAAQDSQDEPLSVERIMECMLQPAVAVGLAHPAFNRLIGRSFLAPPKFLHEHLRAEFDPVMTTFIQALERSLPGIPPDIIGLRLMLAMGAVLMFGMQASAGKGKRDPRREAAVLKELVRFAASGIASAPATSGAELARLRPPGKGKGA